MLDAGANPQVKRLALVELRGLEPLTLACHLFDNLSRPRLWENCNSVDEGMRCLPPTSNAQVSQIPRRRPRSDLASTRQPPTRRYCGRLCSAAPETRPVLRPAPPGQPGWRGPRPSFDLTFTTPQVLDAAEADADLRMRSQPEQTRLHRAVAAAPAARLRWRFQPVRTCSGHRHLPSLPYLSRSAGWPG
jgi:hypothetical protein